jgi:hypothetical protein
MPLMALVGLAAGGPPVAGTVAGGPPAYCYLGSVLTWHGCIVNWGALVPSGFES